MDHPLRLRLLPPIPGTGVECLFRPLDNPVHSGDNLDNPLRGSESGDGRFMALCLVVEDELHNRQLLEALLRERGYEVILAEDGQTGLAACRNYRPEVVVLDLGLPDIDGLELLPQLLSASPLTRIVVQTGRESVRAAVSALRAGARHYLVKPWDRDELLLVLQRESEAVSFEQLHDREEPTRMMWGTNRRMLELRNSLARLAQSPLTPVLIEGKTGSGKGMVARQLHEASCPSGPFVTLNCAAVPSELLESELFGHEKGAFTGAEFRRRGLAELAHGGTLFLDEIADMPLPLQTKLLRFLEDRTIRRVGGENEIRVKCRIVAATLHDLDTCVADGRFRQDLYYRVAVVRLRIPALTERKEDLLPLAYRLLEQIAKTTGQVPKALTPGAERALLNHEWPGNVRELRNRLERALVLGQRPRIDVEDLDLYPRSVAVPTVPPSSSPEQMDDPDIIRRALTETRWNVAKTARRLGVERHWLRYRMEKYGLMKPLKG
ncbi:MAG: sigma-54-dependent transcriptional regulator [Acidobacteriota bacterium]